MKKSFFKRSLALAVAAALTVTSLPVNMVFAEEAVIEEVAEIAAEPVEADVPDAVVDEPADTDVVLDDAAVEDVAAPAADAAEEVPAEEAAPVDGISLEGIEEVDPVDLLDDAANDPMAVATAPDPITGVTVEKTGEDSYTLKWNATEWANGGYDIEISDALYQYKYYSGSLYHVPSTSGAVPSVNMSTLQYADLYGYEALSDGTWQRKNIGTAEEPKYVRPFCPGSTYNIRIRAINRAADGTVAEGAYSEVYSYAVPALEIPEVMDVRVFNDTLYWNGNADRYRIQVKNTRTGELYVPGWAGDSAVKEIPNPVSTSSKSYDLKDLMSRLYTYIASTDPENPGYVPAKSGDWTEQTKYDPSKYLHPFAVGDQYEFIVTPVNVKYDSDGEILGAEVPGTPSAPVLYTREADKVKNPPAVVAGVKYQEGKDGSAGTLSWNSTPDADGYVIEVLDATENNFYYAGVRTLLQKTPGKDEAGNDIEKTNYALMYYSQSSTTLNLSSMMNDLYTYDFTDPTVRPIMKEDSATGETLTAFKLGHTYRVRVMAYSGQYNGREGENDSLVWGQGWSAATNEGVTFTIADPSQNVPQKILQVVLDEDLSLSWKEDKGSDAYEIKVTDGVNEYFTGSSRTPIEVEDESIDLSDTSFYLWVQVDGEFRQKLNPVTGTRITAFSQPGATYYIYVTGVKKGADGQRVAVSPEATVVTYTVPNKTDGMSGDPAQVTGVTLKTEFKTDDPDYQNEPLLFWDYIPNAAGYEVRIRDEEGNEYLSGGVGFDEEKQAAKYNYWWVSNPEESPAGEYPSVSWGSLKGLTAYRPNLNYASPVPDPEATTSASYLTTFKAGHTYTIDVRAVNEYTAYDAVKGKTETTTKEGPWSAPITYTEPAAEAAYTVISDLKYLSEDKDNYYFTYNTPVANVSTVYYQIALDPGFTSLVRSTSWISDSKSDDYKLAVSKDSFKLEPSTTYYIRAISSKKYPNEKDIPELLTIQGIPFATIPAKVAKNITGLYLYKTNENNFEFRFDAVLEDNKDHGKDLYELQYTSNPAPAEGDWISVEQTETPILDMSLLKEGITYVRAVGYILDPNGEKVYGVPSNVVSVTVSYATTVITNLKLVEKTRSGFVFQYDGAPRKDEKVEVWYSEKENFAGDKLLTKITSEGVKDNQGRFEIPYTELNPGKTYYVRARVYNSKAEDASVTMLPYSDFTGSVKIKAVIPTIRVYGTSVADKSITLVMGMANSKETNGYLTGYEIQQKDGKKYNAVAKITDNTYKLTGLEPDTSYVFRVRPYYYNEETKKTTNGDWVFCETMTWGDALNLQAKAKSKNSVKLTWDKVKDASGYEVYRCVTSSSLTTSTDYSSESDDFYKYEFVGTVKQPTKKKAKTASYTDKGLVAKASYSYMVRAYKEVDSKTYYISESADVDLSFNSFGALSIVQQSSGKVKVTWSRVFSAKGYLVEKYDETAEKWVTVKTLKDKKTSYTLPATSDAKGVKYRIRAYNKGNKYTDAIEHTVKPYLAAPKKVKATVDNKNNSIKITWKPVSGADYYMVYRTTSSYAIKNTTDKSYNYQFGVDPVPLYVADESMVSGYRLVTDTKEMAVTTLVDRPITYENNGVKNTLYAGPDLGVTYYYYVVAYKNGKAYIYENQYEGSNTRVRSNDEDQSAVVPISSGASKAASAMVTDVKVAKPKIKSAKAKKGKVTLKWKKDKEMEGYEIYRSTTKKKGYELIGTAKGSAKKYVDKTAQKGKKYYYKIRAYKLNEAGIETYSKDSKAKNVTVK